MGKVSDKSCRENQNIQFMYNFFSFENRAVNVIIWKNMVQPDRQATDDNIIRRVRFACWRTMATDAHSEYVKLLLFHCNNGYANVLQCYKYFICLVVDLTALLTKDILPRIRMNK